MDLIQPAPGQLAVTRLVNRAVRLAHRLVGFGTDTPPEAQPWAELATDRALRDITHQAEAHHRIRVTGTARLPHGPSSATG